MSDDEQWPGSCMLLPAHVPVTAAGLALMLVVLVAVIVSGVPYLLDGNRQPSAPPPRPSLVRTAVPRVQVGAP